jgi:mannose-6-phosphate isomerase-like protein (cupin superfamily)
MTTILARPRTAPLRRETTTMTTTREIEPGEPIDLSRTVVGIARPNRRACIIEQPGGPPERIDGFSIGAPHLTGDPPHNGEMHPDGDEVLYLVSGAVSVCLELAGGNRIVELRGGDALVVPQGVWHKITLEEPGTLVHITPGPSGEHRPL